MMKLLSKVLILLSIAFLLAACGSSSSSEPATDDLADLTGEKGFRGHKWGDPPSKDLVRLESFDTFFNQDRRPGEYITAYRQEEGGFNFNGIDSDGVIYFFINDKFATLLLFFRDEAPYQSVQAQINQKFGPGRPLNSIPGQNMFIWPELSNRVAAFTPNPVPGQYAIVIFKQDLALASWSEVVTQNKITNKIESALEVND